MFIEILKYIEEVRYFQLREENPLLLLELFHQNDLPTMLLANHLKRLWDSDKKFKNQTIELAVRCFAEFIQHIFKVNFKFIPDSSNAIAFTSKNSKNIIGYNFSVEDQIQLRLKFGELVFCQP